MFTFWFVHRSFRAFDMIKFVRIEKTTENTILDCRRCENLFGKRDKCVYTYNYFILLLANRIQTGIYDQNRGHRSNCKLPTY